MSIVWREALEVGDEGIDSDHKHLVDLINAFEIAVSGKIDHKKIAHILLGLAEYTQDHFKREEAIQLTINYPYYDSHRHAHRGVLKQLGAIVDLYAYHKDERERDKIVRDLAAFLKEWLVEHIIHSDLRMKPFLEAKKKKMGKKPSEQVNLITP